MDEAIIDIIGDEVTIEISIDPTPISSSPITIDNVPDDDISRNATDDHGDKEKEGGSNPIPGPILVTSPLSNGHSSTDKDKEKEKRKHEEISDKAEEDDDKAEDKHRKKKKKVNIYF